MQVEMNSCSQLATVLMPVLYTPKPAYAHCELTGTPNMPLSMPSSDCLSCCLRAAVSAADVLLLAAACWLACAALKGRN